MVGGFFVLRSPKMGELLLVEELNGEPRVSSKVIAENTERDHRNVKRTIEKHISSLEEFGKVRMEITPLESGQSENVYFLNEDQSTLLLTLMTNKGLVLDFKKNLIKAFSSLKKIAQSDYTQKVLTLETQMSAVKIALDWLNASDSSKLRAMQMLFESNGLDKKLLPSYSDSKGTLLSCSELLTKNNSPVKIVSFNKLLLADGFLEEKDRPSSKGGVKKYKSLTKKGLEYGENLVAPENPKETAPQYYEEKFAELMSIVLEGQK
jgi:phage regulator Rha-like protein